VWKNAQRTDERCFQKAVVSTLSLSLSLSPSLENVKKIYSESIFVCLFFPGDFLEELLFDWLTYWLIGSTKFDSQPNAKCLLIVSASELERMSRVQTKRFADSTRLDLETDPHSIALRDLFALHILSSGEWRLHQKSKACPIIAHGIFHQSPTCRIGFETPEYLLTNLHFRGQRNLVNFWWAWILDLITLNCACSSSILLFTLSLTLMTINFTHTFILSYTLTLIYPTFSRSFATLTSVCSTSPLPTS
jgi:hypothetical protein